MKIIFSGFFSRAKGRKSSKGRNAKRDDNHIRIDTKNGEIVIEKGAPMSFEEANRGHCNPRYLLGGGYNRNCQACVAACIARFRGFRVSALPYGNNASIKRLSHNTSLAYYTPDGHHPKRMPLKGRNYMRQMNKMMKDNDVYSMEFIFKGKAYGHICIAMKEAGKVFLYDPQIGKVFRSKASIMVYMHDVDKRTIRVMNLTNVTIDTRFCSRIFEKSET
ncbi:MAG: hypothetical protein LUD50_01810 [Clostridia bacterium]|nr:hypothetical protein [Clostridia bacterium]